MPIIDGIYENDLTTIYRLQKATKLVEVCDSVWQASVSQQCTLHKLSKLAARNAAIL
jgi:hypothetical protein